MVLNLQLIHLIYIGIQQGNFWTKGGGIVQFEFSELKIGPLATSNHTYYLSVAMIMIMIMAMIVIVRMAISMYWQTLMCRVNPPNSCRIFCNFQIREIHGDSLSIASHQDAFQALILQGIDLLVRYIRWYKNEITLLS